MKATLFSSLDRRQKLVVDVDRIKKWNSDNEFRELNHCKRQLGLELIITSAKFESPVFF